MSKHHSDFGTLERAQHGEGVEDETPQAGVKRRRYPSTWELMAAKGTITDAMRHAAERFNSDFELGGMHGSFGGMTIDRVDNGGLRGGEPDHIISARKRVAEALDAVGGTKAQSALWWCVGLNVSLRDAEKEVGKSATVLGGILYAALENLARHYGYER